MSKMEILFGVVTLLLSVIISLTSFAFLYGRDISEIKTKVNLMWDVGIVDKLMQSKNILSMSPWRFKDGFLENLKCCLMPKEVVDCMVMIARCKKVKSESQIKTLAIKTLGFEYLKARAIKGNVPMTEYLYYWVIAVREIRELGVDNFVLKIGKNVRN